MAVPSSKSFRWQSLAPLPTGRVYCSPVEGAAGGGGGGGGGLYLIGGCDQTGTPLSSCEVYSPEADRWISLPPMPTARAGAGVAAVGKRLLVIGGVGLHQRPLSSVETYSPEDGRWERRPPLREAAMGVSLTVKDCRVYVVGGMGHTMFPQGLLQQYDALKDVWLPLASMPTPRYAASIFLRGSKIHVFGGRQAKSPVSAYEVYDTETRLWTRFPSLPAKRSFSSYVMTDTSFLSLGGLQQTRASKQPKFVRTVEVFDIEQGGWMKNERCLNMRKKRADFVAANLQGRVIAAGGLGNQPAVLGSVEAFHPLKKKWESLPSMPTARCSCSSLVFADRLVVLGGVAQGPSRAVEALYLSEA